MKNLIVSILLIFASTLTNAQEAKRPVPKSPEERTKHMLKELTLELGLSELQVQKMKEVILSRELQKEEIRKTYVKGTEEFRKANRKVVTEIEQQFKSILTTEQMNKLQQKRQRMKAKMQERKQQLQK